MCYFIYLFSFCSSGFLCLLFYLHFFFCLLAISFFRCYWLFFIFYCSRFILSISVYIFYYLFEPYFYYSGFIMVFFFTYTLLDKCLFCSVFPCCLINIYFSTFNSVSIYKCYCYIIYFVKIAYFC